MKKRILVIAPAMPQESDIENLASILSFLHRDYQLDFIDPLSLSMELAKDDYYHLWQNELTKYLADYEAFIGFSFGGVILQQCFSLFTQVKKPIFLFSTPTFADEGLQQKLGKVIRLCKEKKLVDALYSLYRDVFFPNQPPQESLETSNEELAASRLIFGLQRVLDTDSRKILLESTVEHLHLIGEESNLVNRDNVLAPKTGQLIVVPKAGMRVLQDNQLFCQKIILERLNCGA